MTTRELSYSEEIMAEHCRLFKAPIQVVAAKEEAPIKMVVAEESPPPGWKQLFDESRPLPSRWETGSEFYHISDSDAARAEFLRTPIDKQVSRRPMWHVDIVAKAHKAKRFEGSKYESLMDGKMDSPQLLIDLVKEVSQVVEPQGIVDTVVTFFKDLVRLPGVVGNAISRVDRGISRALDASGVLMWKTTIILEFICLTLVSIWLARNVVYLVNKMDGARPVLRALSTFISGALAIAALAWGTSAIMEGIIYAVDYFLSPTICNDEERAEEVEVEAHGSNSVTPFHQMTSVLMVLLSEVGTGDKMNNQDRMKMASKNMSYLPKMAAGVATVTDAASWMASNLCPSFVVTLMQRYGLDTGLHVPYKLEILFMQAIAVLNRHNEEGDKMFLSRVDAANVLALDRSFTESLLTDVLVAPNGVARIATNIHSRIQKLVPAARVAMKTLSNRVTPIGLWFKGAPGVGKSYIISYLVTLLYPELSHHEALWSINSTAEFDEGMVGQPIALIDDVGSTDQEASMSKLLQWMSPVAATARKADIASKGMPINFQVVICTTNLELDSYAMKRFNTPEAFIRRFSSAVGMEILPCIKPNFKEDGSERVAVDAVRNLPQSERLRLSHVQFVVRRGNDIQRYTFFELVREIRVMMEVQKLQHEETEELLARLKTAYSDWENEVPVDIQMSSKKRGGGRGRAGRRNRRNQQAARKATIMKNVRPPLKDIKPVFADDASEPDSPGVSLTPAPGVPVKSEMLGDAANRLCPKDPSQTSSESDWDVNNPSEDMKTSPEAADVVRSSSSVRMRSTPFPSAEPVKPVLAGDLPSCRVSEDSWVPSASDVAHGLKPMASPVGSVKPKPQISVVRENAFVRTEVGRVVLEVAPVNCCCGSCNYLSDEWDGITPCPRCGLTLSEMFVRLVKTPEVLREHGRRPTTLPVQEIKPADGSGKTMRERFTLWKNALTGNLSAFLGSGFVKLLQVTVAAMGAVQLGTMMMGASTIQGLDEVKERLRTIPETRDQIDRHERWKKLITGTEDKVLTEFERDRVANHDKVVVAYRALLLKKEALQADLKQAQLKANEIVTNADDYTIVRKESRGQEVRARTREVAVTGESGADWKPKLLKNQYRISRDGKNNVEHSLTATVLRGRTILVNRHFFVDQNTPSGYLARDSIFHLTNATRGTFKCVFDPDAVFPFKTPEGLDEDIILLVVPELQAHSSILHLFANDAHLSKRERITGGLSLVGVDPQGDAVQMDMEWARKQAIHFTWRTDPNLDKADTAVADCFYYPPKTAYGDCGSLLYHETDSGRGPVLALHSGQRPWSKEQVSFGVILSYRKLNVALAQYGNFLANKGTPEVIVASESLSILRRNVCVPVEKPLESVGAYVGYNGCEGKTELRESPIAKLLPQCNLVEKEPADLTDADHTRLMAEVVKMGSVTMPPALKILQTSVTHVELELSHVIRGSGVTLRPLTSDEILNGTDEFSLKGMKGDTSMGCGSPIAMRDGSYTFERPKPNKAKKSAWFTRDADERWAINPTQLPAALAWVDQQLLQGVRLECLFFARFKDELRFYTSAHLDAHPGLLQKTTRIFLVAPFFHYYFSKKYWGALTGTIFSKCFVTDLAAGWDPNSSDFQAMRRRLREVSSVGYSTDVKNYQSTHDPHTSRAITGLFNRLFKRYGGSEWRAAHDRARCALAEMTHFTQIVVHNVCVQRHTGFSTGVFLTLFRNGVRRMLLKFNSWQEIMRADSITATALLGPAPWSLHVCDRHVRSVIQGDDCKSAVSTKAGILFNGLSEAQACARRGITLTAADKSAPDAKLFLLDSLDFCSVSGHPESEGRLPGQDVIAVLDRAVIAKQLKYIRIGQDEDVSIVENCDNALREIWNYGSAEFSVWRCDMQEALSQAGIRPQLLTADEVLEGRLLKERRRADARAATLLLYPVVKVRAQMGNQITRNLNIGQITDSSIDAGSSDNLSTNVSAAMNDTPNVSVPPVQVTERTTYISTAQGVRYAQNMSLYASPKNPPSMSEMGMDNSELALAYLLSKPTLLHTFSWLEAENPGDVLYHTLLLPTYQFLGPTDGFIVQQSTLLAQLALRYRFFTGSLRYTFEFIASDLVTGTCVIAPRYLNNDEPQDLLDATSQYATIFRLAEGNRQITVDVPFYNPNPWLEVTNGNQPDRSYGSLSVVCSIPLQTLEATGQFVDCNVYVSAGPDFKLSFFGSQNQSVTPQFIPYEANSEVKVEEKKEAPRRRREVTVVAQMSGVDATGVNFEEANEIQTLGKPQEEKTQSVGATTAVGESQLSYSDVARKPIIISTLAWSAGDPVGSIIWFDRVPFSLVAGPAAAVFGQFRLCRGDVLLIFTTNGTKFAAGSLAAGFVPLTSTSEAHNVVLSNRTNWNLRNIIRLRPNESTGVVLRITWNHYQEWLDTDGSVDMGLAFLGVFNRLNLGVGAVPTVRVQISVQFEMEFMLLRHVPVIQLYPSRTLAKIRAARTAREVAVVAEMATAPSETKTDEGLQLEVTKLTEVAPPGSSGAPVNCHELTDSILTTMKRASPIFVLDSPGGATEHIEIPVSALLCPEGFGDGNQGALVPQQSVFASWYRIWRGAVRFHVLNSGLNAVTMQFRPGNERGENRTELFEHSVLLRTANAGPFVHLPEDKTVGSVLCPYTSKYKYLKVPKTRSETWMDEYNFGSVHITSHRNARTVPSAGSTYNAGKLRVFVEVPDNFFMGMLTFLPPMQIFNVVPDKYDEGNPLIIGEFIHVNAVNDNEHPTFSPGADFALLAFAATTGSTKFPAECTSVTWKTADVTQQDNRFLQALGFDVGLTASVTISPGVTTTLDAHIPTVKMVAVAYVLTWNGKTASPHVNGPWDRTPTNLLNEATVGGWNVGDTGTYTGNALPHTLFKGEIVGLSSTDVGIPLGLPPVSISLPLHVIQIDGDAQQRVGILDAVNKIGLRLI